MPLILDHDGFDEIFFNLQRKIGHENQHRLVGIARTLALWDRDLFTKISTEGPSTEGVPKIGGHVLNFQDFVQNPDPFFSGGNPAMSLPEAEDAQKEALARSWVISSVSNGLSYLWGDGKKKKCEPAGQDLSGIILEDGNFSGADFTGVNLKGASLWNVSLVGANLDKVASFESSDWYNTKWWQAKTVSCELAVYLKSHFYPDATEDKAAAEQLVGTCSK